ncbi:MAG: hypothetical protein GY835_14250 [bacterium]|nr:hypothetical protein [bacterium]
MRSIFCPLSVLLIILCILPGAALSEIVINEVLSRNATGILDEDCDNEDWIEIFNSGPEPINLMNYGLSDDTDDPFKWVFPDIVLHPNYHLLVFASGKDRHLTSVIWDTVIDMGDLWRYRVNTSAPPSDWSDPGFDDGGWSCGPTGIGNGDGDDATEIQQCISFCARREFGVDDPDNIRQLYLHIDYDDAFVARLNGVEIVRVNIGSGEVEWNEAAHSSSEALMYRGGLPACWCVEDPAALLVPGDNVLAVEVHNSSHGSDLSFIPFLSLGMDVKQEGGATQSDIVGHLLPQLHANFKISSEGETITLHDPQGALVDHVFSGAPGGDLSFGRGPDGADNWLYYLEPTPREPNGLDGHPAIAPKPMFTLPNGLYGMPITVALFVPLSEASIHYTLDGSPPDQGSPRYETPLFLTETESIRAITFAPDTYPSEIVTHSYVIDDPSELPITCFTTDPYNLWDEDYGIFFGDNVWESWERPIHVEFFETDGRKVIDQDAGAKVFGGYSRHNAQKSLRFIARGSYGNGKFEHPFFADRNFDTFDQLVWRNAGTDWAHSSFRDGLAQQILAHTDLDRLAFRPTRTYLNGEYWGLYNIRERRDEDYLAANHGVSPDSLDLICNFHSAEAGSIDGYNEMVTYIEEHDLAVGEYYDYILTQMDETQFADYQIFNIYLGNTDWPGNNAAWWRPWSGDTRWRWIIYDLDLTTGLGDGAFNFNSLAFALEPDGPVWPNPPRSTFLLRNLIRNERFLTMFINRFSDHMNSSLLPAPTLALLDLFAANIEDEIGRHHAHWNIPPGHWQTALNNIERFLNNRPAFMRSFIADEFDLDDEITLSLNISPPGAGVIRLSATEVDADWSGIYFQGVPITVTAIPAVGHEFLSWSDAALPAATSVVLNPEGDYSLTVNFTTDATAVRAVINEINYSSSDDFDPGDWVEFTNPTAHDLDLTGWILKDGDDDHAFGFPAGTVLSSGGYLVVCRDTDDFLDCFPYVTCVAGEMDFGFSGSGESLRLFDNYGQLYDVVEYADCAPWPEMPEGNGPTLVLLDPLADNALPASWDVSHEHGTPGTRNIADPTSVEAAPAVTRLGRPYPNPFNPSTRIDFSLAEAGRVKIRILDVGGRCVKTLLDGRREPGEYELTWRGRNDNGQLLPSGLYLLRMECADRGYTQRLMLLK